MGIVSVFNLRSGSRFPVGCCGESSCLQWARAWLWYTFFVAGLSLDINIEVSIEEHLQMQPPILGWNGIRVWWRSNVFVCLRCFRYGTTFQALWFTCFIANRGLKHFLGWNKTFSPRSNPAGSVENDPVTTTILRDPTKYSFLGQIVLGPPTRKNCPWRLEAMRYSSALILAALIYFFQTLLFWPPDVSTESLVPRRTAVAGDLVLEILILMDFTTTPLARSHQILGCQDEIPGFRDGFRWNIFLKKTCLAYLVVNMPT